jgi:polysaccharide biosynthesis protein PslG
VRTHEYRYPVLVLLCGVLAACSTGGLSVTARSARPPGGSPPATVTKTVAFAILEECDKDQDLTDIAKDFQLLQELDIDVLRCSFGWDGYEPARGQ